MREVLHLTRLPAIVDIDKFGRFIIQESVYSVYVSDFLTSNNIKDFVIRVRLHSTSMFIEIELDVDDAVMLLLQHDIESIEKTISETVISHVSDLFKI